MGPQYQIPIRQVYWRQRQRLCSHIIERNPLHYWMESEIGCRNELFVLISIIRNDDDKLKLLHWLKWKLINWIDCVFNRKCELLDYGKWSIRKLSSCWDWDVSSLANALTKCAILLLFDLAMNWGKRLVHSLSGIIMEE